MTAAGERVPASIPWLTDWDATLAQSLATRRVVLIDVWKDP